ncbi:MAG: transcription elongation factor GreA [Candidatus Hydrogenedens sp.]|nr:transcription elongation factor GreA [Candidatus Hydrogenedentota bacterium]NLF59322.1 transcription elongation factor GreA [Candidatus Hydrogenedens sp.]
MDKLYVSADGLDKMKAELTALNERRMVVAAAIEHARGLGDLSENAEYHSAKEQQAMLHARIRDLEDKITRSVVLDRDGVDMSKAYVGATVRVLNLKTGRETTYQLVSPVEADLASGKISTNSPFGRALMGRAEGEETVASVPAGDLPLRVLEITY